MFQNFIGRASLKPEHLLERAFFWEAKEIHFHAFPAGPNEGTYSEFTLTCFIKFAKVQLKMFLFLEDSALYSVSSGPCEPAFVCARAVDSGRQRRPLSQPLPWLYPVLQPPSPLRVCFPEPCLDDTFSVAWVAKQAKLSPLVDRRHPKSGPCWRRRASLVVCVFFLLYSVFLSLQFNQKLPDDT